MEFALPLAPSTKIRGLPLTAAVADRIPGDMINRPQGGFGVPLGPCFREDLAAYLKRLVAAPDTGLRKHHVGSAVERVLAEHAADTRSHGRLLWLLLTLEVLLRRQDW